MRDRGSVVIIENGKVALIKRSRARAVYYVFPGGGIEKGETPEEAAKREAFEELGVEVKLLECIAKVEFNVTQYFFLSKNINGIFGTGQGEEYSSKKSNRGIYLPLWVDLKNLPFINIKPKEKSIPYSVNQGNCFYHHYVQRLDLDVFTEYSNGL